jgi:phosphoribosyl 1,2-cyclic phosphodiesterase
MASKKKTSSKKKKTSKKKVMAKKKTTSQKKNPDDTKHFVIVDDDADSANLLSALLHAAGYTVTYESSSVAALTHIRDKQPDCVISDIMMPEMDGFELCKRLKADEATRDIKIVVVSAKQYDYDQKRALELGADAFVQKPINRQTFLKQIKRVIEDKVEVSFWGVRGTMPVPGSTALRYGGNTPCVSIEFPRGQMFIFDAGTGIRQLSSYLLQRRQRLEAKIFISHPHWDHINSFPFFIPLYIQGNEFEVLGSPQNEKSIRELISAQMDGVFFPIMTREFGANVYFRDLNEGEYEIEGIKVTTMLLNHPGNCLGYRLEYGDRTVCYVTDNELYPETEPFYNEYYVKQLIDFVKDADVLITDSTYMDEEYKTKVHWGHPPLSQVVKLAHRANVKTLYLFHHDPEQTDDDIDEKLKTAKTMLADMDSDTQCVAPSEKTTVSI